MNKTIGSFIRRTLLGALAVGVVLTGPAQAQPPEAAVPAALAAALKAAGIPLAAVALQVQEVGATTPRLSINAAQSMNPASVMKLLTTFAALETLGPAYTWKTTAWIDRPLDGEVLNGDLYLKGSGDPKLTFEQFWLLLRQLRARGLREIRGDLVLDNTAFEPPGQDPGSFDAQPLRPYNVEPDALLVGFKTIRLNLVPDPAVKQVRLGIEPQPANLEVINLLRLANNGCGDWKDKLRADLSQRGGRFRLVLTGGYPASCGEKDWHLGVLPHADYAYGVFETLWAELGGSIAGGVRQGAAGAGAREIAAIESPSLGEIVRDINKFSNNVMARHLFLTLGLESGKRPARLEDGDAAVRAWLEARNLRFPELVLENGSGLSRRERISAASLGRLLQAAWKSPLMPEFLASLPLTAVDGTMRKRLKDKNIAGQAHIKTGSLEGVKAIAGFVLDRAGRYQTVVFLINHGNAAAGQAAQDALLQWVYEGGTP